MLSRATWRDREKSSTLRSKSVLSLMQNWAAASLMVSCGGQSSQNPPSSAQTSSHPVNHQTNKVPPSDVCLDFDTTKELSKGGRQRPTPTAS